MGKGMTFKKKNQVVTRGTIEKIVKKDKDDIVDGLANNVTDNVVALMDEALIRYFGFGKKRLVRFHLCLDEVCDMIADGDLTWGEIDARRIKRGIKLKGVLGGRICVKRRVK